MVNDSHEKCECPARSHPESTTVHRHYVQTVPVTYACTVTAIYCKLRLIKKTNTLLIIKQIWDGGEKNKQNDTHAV